MSSAHTDIAPELRRLAQAILDGIDPAVRAAAALAAGGAAGGTAGKCQQVWCPVCALAAVVNGEQHPLVTVIADHSVALLDVIRAIVADLDQSAAPPAQDGPPEDDSTTDPPAPASTGNGINNGTGAAKGTAKTGYQPIPVTVQE